MDFLFMVRGIGLAFITGPRVVEAITGKEVTDEELGGADAAQARNATIQNVSVPSHNSLNLAFPRAF
jgi:acetyl-CoA carboxylase carboxyltransferase component